MIVMNNNNKNIWLEIRFSKAEHTILLNKCALQNGSNKNVAWSFDLERRLNRNSPSLKGVYPYRKKNLKFFAF